MGLHCVEGMGSQFACPVSRHTEVRWNDLLAIEEMHVAAASDETGVGLSRNAMAQISTCSIIWNTTPTRWRASTSATACKRIPMQRMFPSNYFPDDNPNKVPGKPTGPSRSATVLCELGRVIIKLWPAGRGLLCIRAPGL